MIAGLREPLLGRFPGPHRLLRSKQQGTAYVPLNVPK